jgi:hypothetical protein
VVDPCKHAPQCIQCAPARRTQRVRR